MHPSYITHRHWCLTGELTVVELVLSLLQICSVSLLFSVQILYNVIGSHKIRFRGHTMGLIPGMDHTQLMCVTLFFSNCGLYDMQAHQWQ